MTGITRNNTIARETILPSIIFPTVVSLPGAKKIEPNTKAPVTAIRTPTIAKVAHIKRSSLFGVGDMAYNENAGQEAPWPANPRKETRDDKASQAPGLYSGVPWRSRQASRVLVKPGGASPQGLALSFWIQSRLAHVQAAAGIGGAYARGRSRAIARAV